MDHHRPAQEIAAAEAGVDLHEEDVGRVRAGVVLDRQPRVLSITVPVVWARTFVAAHACKAPRSRNQYQHVGPCVLALLLPTRCNKLLIPGKDTCREDVAGQASGVLSEATAASDWRRTRSLGARAGHQSYSWQLGEDRTPAEACAYKERLRGPS